MTTGNESLEILANPEPVTHVYSKCPHCGQQATMPMIECGDFRVCVVCPDCGQHKRIGARSAVQLILGKNAKVKAAGAE